MKALQHPGELQTFVDLLRREGVRSYLEIGSKFGGSFGAVTRALPRGSRAVCVDLPAGTKHWKASHSSLVACCEGLIKSGYDVHLIWGDSTADDVIKRVAGLGPFDAVLIDGNHTLPYVQSDWLNYGPLSRLVAFHDIAWARPDDWTGYQINVPEFWNLIKARYRHQEIKLDPTRRDNGIGIIWREERHAEQEQEPGSHDAGSGAFPEVR